MEAAVRWSPHRRRFLVVNVPDPKLTLNEIETLSRKSIKYRPVAQCSKLSNFGAFDWSKTDESVVALGLVSGSASLIRLIDGDDKSETVATFRIKQQRKCNSIALSTRDWLAVALDKTRSDVCLFIYDANRPSGETSDPIRRLCAAEIVSSVKFFPSQPQELIASTQRSFIRLYDLRDGSVGGPGGQQVATKNINNIAIDPLNENYFASAGSTDDPSVTVWDRRWISAPSHSSSSASSSSLSNAGAVFDFKMGDSNLHKTTVWSLRYSAQKQGRLAVLTSTGELSVIDMAESPSSVLQSSDYLPYNSHGGAMWSCNRYVSESRCLEHPWYNERYGRERRSRIVAFDWIPSDHRSSEQSILALRPNREVDVIPVSSSAPFATVTARNDLAMSSVDFDLSLLEWFGSDNGHTGGHLREQNQQRQLEADDIDDDKRLGPTHQVGYRDTATHQLTSTSTQNVLKSSAIQRERCKQGYLFDPGVNIKLVAGDSHLEHLWEFIQRFRNLASGGGMVCGGIDFSYLGISGIWNERLGGSARRRLVAEAPNVEEAIIGLNAAREIPAFEGHRTDFPEHRQLCLAICGWKFTRDDLEHECQELIDRGFPYQAIVQAVLHEEQNIALNLLRDLIRTKTIQNIGLGALLAADQLNAQQREMCLWMAADTDDPALKALLAYLNTGDWRDVMSTPYLHLGYRMALGLKYLSDTELSNYIQSQTSIVVMNGTLEGILLTGLGEQAMDLFQTYIVRTNDLQTAVLATAFTNPLFVDDVRWGMWKETYFQHMQTWQAFVERSLFTVQHNRLAKTREGKNMLHPRPSQIALKCTHCRGSLSGTEGSLTLSTSHKTVRAARPAANAGTLCPQCGRHMPRCGICRMWLGTPNPALVAKSRNLSRLGDVMGKLLTFCHSCGHGFHADHAESWFVQHEVCPVPDCKCLCALKS